MSIVILDLAVSLDGFIEGPRGEVDWCVMDDDMDFGGFLATISAIFYGRVSYEAWGTYQPGPDANEAELKLWQAVHSKKKYVFSGKPVHDNRATFIKSDIAERVAG